MHNAAGRLESASIGVELFLEEGKVLRITLCKKIGWIKWKKEKFNEWSDILKEINRMIFKDDIVTYTYKSQNKLPNECC